MTKPLLLLLTGLLLILSMTPTASAADQPTPANAAGQPLHTFNDPLETGLGTRVIRLRDGTLLATFERWINAEPQPSVPYLIKRSTDGGATWQTMADLEDDETGFCASSSGNTT